MRIKRGDLVEVIQGSDARRPGGKAVPRRVLQIVADGQKVLVEGVNRVFKHVRRGHPKSPQGGRLSREMPVDISNVQLYCESCARGVRVGVRYSEDGAKYRYCKKCKTDFGQISPAKARYAKSGS